MRSTILLTGASGFVGRAIVAALLQERYDLVCPVRHALHLPGARTPVMPDMGERADWRACLGGVQTVIHCAARVHVMQDGATDPLAAYRQVNVAATLNLARQAAEAGVRQFIFLSSVKVNGEETPLNQPYTEDSAPAPIDPYGISKHEAETALLQLANETGMAVTILRPPLVYGPGVKANFRSMLRWVKKGVPLPLASVRNKRSFVYLGNLVSLVQTCMGHPQAANQVFLVSDRDDLSSAELLRLAAAAMHRPAHLLPCPPGALLWLARLAGRESAAQRLVQSLQVDAGKAARVLGWTPPYTVAEGLSATVKDLIEN